MDGLRLRPGAGGADSPPGCSSSRRSRASRRRWPRSIRSWPRTRCCSPTRRRSPTSTPSPTSTRRRRGRVRRGVLGDHRRLTAPRRRRPRLRHVTTTIEPTGTTPSSARRGARIVVTLRPDRARRRWCWPARCSSPLGAPACVARSAGDRRCRSSCSSRSPASSSSPSLAVPRPARRLAPYGLLSPGMLLAGAVLPRAAVHAAAHVAVDAAEPLRRRGRVRLELRQLRRRPHRLRRPVPAWLPLRRHRHAC